VNILQLSDQGFGEDGHFRCILGIAEKDPASEWPAFPSRAFPGTLKRASLRRKFCSRRYARLEKEFCFPGGQKQRVSEFRKSAASSGLVASTGTQRQCVIHRAEKLGQFFSKWNRIRYGHGGNPFPLKAHDGSLLIDFLDRVQSAGSRSGTDFTGSIPGFFCSDVAVPKGPGSALAWTGFVDGTADAWIVQNTVKIGFFDETTTDTDHPGVASLEVLLRQAQRVGEPLGFFAIDPNVAGCATATFSASRTREPQTITVPRLLGGAHVGFLFAADRRLRLFSEAHDRHAFVFRLGDHRASQAIANAQQVVDL
jgi:hypothetical protein